MGYGGYFLKFGTAELPNNLLIADSYKCTPDQKIIIDSFVDVNRNEHREVSKNKKSSVSVTTKGYLTSSEKSLVLDVLGQGLLNEIEGRYKVTFWNPNKDGYSTMEAFLENIEFTVAMALDSGPVYNGITIELNQDRG